jgi:hypothetical protein
MGLAKHRQLFHSGKKRALQLKVAPLLNDPIKHGGLANADIF